MAKKVIVSKWGNAQGIRLPEAFCRQLGIAVGDEVSLSITRDKLIVAKASDQYTLQARKKAWDGRGGAGGEYDWGPPAGKELW